MTLLISGCDPQEVGTRFEEAECAYSFDFGHFPEFADISFTITDWNGIKKEQELSSVAAKSMFPSKLTAANAPATFTVTIHAKFKDDYKMKYGDPVPLDYNYNLSCQCCYNDGSELSYAVASTKGGQGEIVSTVSALKKAVAALDGTTLTITVGSDGMIKTGKKQDPQPESKETVTIMYYGAGGGNLDGKQIRKMRQCASIGAEEWLSMTFEYKFSDKLIIKSYDDTGMEGVFRMDLADCASLRGCEVFPYTIEEENISKNIVGLPLQQYKEDSGYKLYEPQNIADFIKWSVEKHPADKYVLILADHGGGWTLSSDGIMPATKGIIYDDNVNNMCISARNLVDGIKLSGVHIDYLYNDACLMNALENIYEYKEVADYHISSMEMSYGGDYERMLRALKNNHGDLYSGFVEYIDAHIDGQEKSWANCYVDLSICNLRKVDGVLTPVLKSAITYLNKVVDTDENAKSFATAAGRLAAMAGTSEVWVPLEVVKDCQALYQSGFKLSKNENYGYLRGVYPRLIMKNHPEKWNAYSDDSKNYTINSIGNSSCYGVCFADILNQIIQFDVFAKEYPELYAEGKKLYADYLNAVKSVLYIGATNLQSEDIAYLECSPSINLMALNENGWKPFRSETGVYNGIYEASKYTLDVATLMYKNTTFDKEVSWSSFLVKNTNNANLLSNDSRELRYRK